MDVIRHDDGDIKVDLDAVVVQATIENDGTGLLWQAPAMFGAKGEEVGFAVALQMRKLSSIESLRHRTC